MSFFTEPAMIAWYAMLFVIWGPFLFIRPSQYARRIDPLLFPAAMRMVPAYWEPKVRSVCQLRGLGRGTYIAAHPYAFGYLLSLDEQRAALMHEIGHHVLGHTWKRSALGSAITLALAISMALAPWWSYVAVFAIWYACSMTVVGIIWRGHEFDADEWMAQRSDATALIRAIARVTPDWTKQTAIHPSVAKRAQFLAVDLEAIRLQLEAERERSELPHKIPGCTTSV